MKIRATPRLAQPFITSPASRMPSSDGRSPNGSSPSPTIRKTAIVASTQNAAVSTTLCTAAVVLFRSARGLHDPVEGQEGAHDQLSHLSCSFLSFPSYTPTTNGPPPN